MGGFKMADLGGLSLVLNTIVTRDQEAEILLITPRDQAMSILDSFDAGLQPCRYSQAETGTIRRSTDKVTAWYTSDASLPGDRWVLYIPG